MKIALRSSGPSRQWHQRLTEALCDLGHNLVLKNVAGARLPTGLGLLLKLEGRLYNARTVLFEPGHVDRAAPTDQPIDLLLEPLFDGVPGETALIEALLQRRSPSIAVQALRSGVWTDLAVGLPAIEQPDVLAKSLDQVLVRMIALILQAVRNLDDTAACHSSLALASNRSLPPAIFLLTGMMRKITRRLGVPREQWRMALRRAPARRGSSWRVGEFEWLGAGDARFQADPFLFAANESLHLFYEELSGTTGRGVIAAMQIDATGNASSPRVVLEQPFHLSYPFVIEHDGAIFMLPEMSQARRVQLFRAAPFPDRWVPDRTIIDDIDANDATLVFHEGRYWMFTTLSGDGGSSWDQLGLFHAADLFGPWVAHRGNPVLIDAGGARPAGAMWHEAGTLMRVAQDCRAGYGTGLAICRVDRLDLDVFEQTIVVRIEAPVGLDASGIHTLNRAGAFEVTDFKRACG